MSYNHCTLITSVGIIRRSPSLVIPTHGVGVGDGAAKMWHLLMYPATWELIDERANKYRDGLKGGP